MLSAEQIHSGYHGVEVLHGVSVHVQEGEIVSLIGLNGAGKSTLLRTLSGMLKADRGRILFAGEDITRSSPDRLVERGLVHIPESRMLFSPLTVEENLLLGTAAKSRKFRREKCAERLELVYDLFPILKERMRQRAGTLSGGEQQMLAIGRGLMSDPKLLLMDEPSLGLAPIVVDNIFAAIKRLNRDGLTIFLVEQNVSKALELCDRAYVLDLGGVILSGSGRELLNNPQIREIYLGEFETA
jgi:branched-chain amino acid transport system ATP-binding protein